MRFEFIKCHGSGNDFPLIDARGLTLPDAQWAAIARALADRAGPVGGDGLLLLVDGRDEAPFGQRMFNPDGSEAETCLNGLRCVARAGFDATGLDAALVGLPKSDAWAARVTDLAPGVATIATRVTSVSANARDVGLTVGDRFVDAPIPGLPSERRFTALAMPNPHLIAFVDMVDEAELVALGDWCESAPPLIPGRANVSFVAMGDDGSLFVRTYERGVGLTDSCGSAMAASVHAAALTGRIGWDVEVVVRNRGGLVRGRTNVEPSVEIAGNATFEYRAAVDFAPDTGQLGAVTLIEDRAVERDAWRSLLTASRN